VAGIEGDHLVDLWLSGVYVGTDITGRAAVPNGIGIESGEAGVSEPSLMDQLVDQLEALRSNDHVPLARTLESQPRLQIGGASTALTGACSYPCNIIAGNSGTGIRLTFSSSVVNNESYIAGNFFGVSSSGQALPNGGPDIAVAGVANANPLRIGGAISEGNVLNDAGYPAISVTGPTNDTTTPPVAIQDNTFQVTGGAVPISRPAIDPTPPRILDVKPTGSKIEVIGQVSARAFFGRAQTLELYASSSCTGALRAVGQFSVTKQGGEFDVSVLKRDLTTDKFISALVTDGERYTSTFSTFQPLPLTGAAAC
jgi:hypothetical protein